MVEYALILCLVALAAITMLGAIGQNAHSMFSNLLNEMKAVGI
jgi:Flp pilus assembly pilin Flp